MTRHVDTQAEPGVKSPEAEASTSFTDEMRAASKRSHSLSDALVNARLVVLFTDRILYGRAIACFYFVFKALEEALTVAVKIQPDLKRFGELLPQLFRSEAFRVDLQFYLDSCPGGWSKAAEMEHSPAIRRYEERLRCLTKENPRLLLAHAYTQLLAITAGGQIIRRMARKQMGLPESLGTASFEYPTDAPSPSTLSTKFKAELNSWADGLTPEIRLQLIKEHCAVFRYNTAIITSFRVGWSTFFRGVMTLLRRNLWIVLLLAIVVLAAAAAAWMN